MASPPTCLVFHLRRRIETHHNRRLSWSSRRLLRRFSSSPTYDDSISLHGVSSSGGRCVKFGDQLLVSILWSYRFHFLFYVSMVNIVVIEGVLRLNFQVKARSMLCFKRIQYVTLIVMNVPAIILRFSSKMALTLALRRSSKVFLFMFLLLE
ncbi:unnamed protein product [Brassica rapa]|uniref:Uncharacterized protein n=1 Tax=Brassica campestris TaxID=3711 RepID=A0A8D9G5D9_BRACM|nr:unnamed protein product [Brassica rapa]